MSEENTYENVRRIRTDEGATFVPVCKNCGRFVKVDDELIFDGNDQPYGTNADCKNCGRTEMIFEGYY